GQVYLAHDDSLDRSIAIKVMHPSRASDPVARYRFICESRATAAVEHPHVVTIYQVGEIDSDGAGHGLPYIVMQFLQGDTLGAYRATMDQVPLMEALRIGREIADGLCGAHRRGLIHRDIKPENIFLEGPERQVKIIDFGLARDVIEEPVAAHLTADGAVVGTPAYMSPERIGRQPIDIRSDIFGLGVVLYELLAGRLPFEGVTMMEMLVDIARGSPPALSSVAAAVPADVSNLVMRMIAHDPGQRPASAGAVSEEIGTIEKRLKAG
ncbi:MAG: serine/threonine protein kinase, partial [Planctomycetes bacterium]|nr:serine/threonine protein kinase [Planctomycetota bacterium]